MKARSHWVGPPCGCGVAVCLLILTTPALGLNPIEATGRSLTNIAAIRQLSTEAAAAGRPVEIEGTVIYYDPGWRCLFLQDGRDAIFVLTETNRQPILPGDRIRLNGRTREGSYAPIVIEPVMVKLSDASLPAGSRQRVSTLLDGQFDGQRVEVGGIVRRVFKRGGRMGIDLVSDGLSLRTWIPEGDATSWEHLVGGAVRVTGACGVVALDGRITAVQVFMPDMSGLVVERPAPSDPFGLPPTAIADLLTTGDREPYPDLVRLVGRVLATDGGRRLELQDASGQIDVWTQVAMRVLPGQKVEVVGFRSSSTAEPRLEDARLRSIETLDNGRQLVSQEPVLATAGSGEERLVTAQQVRNLSKMDAERELPVTLVGVVTYYDSDWGTFFVQDDTAGIFVNLGTERVDVQVGQLVRIEGVSGPGDFAPVLQNPSIRILGPGVMPAPLRRDLQRLLTGREDSQWVEVEGVVRAVYWDATRWYIQIAQSGGRFQAYIPLTGDLAPPIHWIDSAVRVTGVCGSIFNHRRQFLGIQMFVPDPGHLRIELAAPDDPYSVASQSIGSLMQFNPDRASGHRTKVTGVVTVVEHGDRFFVQDGTGGLRLFKQPGIEVQPGDRIEVLGFPGLSLHAPVLEDTTYRVVGREVLPAPIVITAGNGWGINGGQGIIENQRVRIQGRLIDVRRVNDRPVLLFQDGSDLFHAHVEDADDDMAGHVLRPGSWIELTGACTLQVGHQGEVVAVEIHVATIDDIEVLQAAPWWTPTYTARAMYAGGLLVLGCAVWLTTLRRRVRDQAETIRQRRERELALERRDRTLTHHSVVGIWQVDPQGRTLFVNPAMRRLLGVDHETDFLGREADAFLPGLKTLCRVAEGGRPDMGTVTPQEAEVITASGRRRAVLASVAPIVDEAGRVESWIGTAVDITGMKEVEAELQEAKESAESASRAKSQFLANMSHEIRTPMNGVIGMINLLLRSPLNREQQDFARTVRDSAELLLSLIDDILDFSKIEAGRLALDAVDFDLREVVESSVQVLSHRAADHGLGFGSIIRQEVPLAVRGDPTRLRQVLLNLLSNAIKFTEQGEVLLQVSLESVHETGHLLRFEVHDTGIGIDPEVQDVLFQPFVQADGSTTRKYGGTGLGLAISRQLVRLFRGEIGVRSEAGRGSVFWFTARLEPAIEPLDQGDGLPECFAGKRALVVDDNEVNRRIVGHHLDSWGITWDAVATPELGLERLRVEAERNPYDVAILDMQMPGMDGMMMTSRIRTDPAIAATRVLLLTSMGQDLDRLGLRSLTIRECLNKPFRQEDLRNCMQRLLRSPGDTALHTSDYKDTTTWSAAATPPATAKNPLRILVAEDNAVNQKVALRQLAALGYVADLVEDGLQALETCARTPYDVILMDCQMPRMDGYEATRRIREREQAGPAMSRRGRINIIAMTAHAMHGDREKCIEAGMDEYLTKPLLLDELETVLEQVGVRCNSYEPMGGVNPDPETSQRLNQQTLDRIGALGSASLVGEIVELYLGEAPGLLGQLRQAQEAGDRPALERAAHTLKGSSNNVGADRLANLLREIEENCRLGGTLLDEQGLATVMAEFKATGDALRGVCTGQG
jgi:PAS domain S-box-containing protein